MQVRQIRGYGPRRGRVHVFDRRHGYFVATGYMRDGILFTAADLRSPFDHARLVIRPFTGRAPRTPHLGA